jgi:hypothetical protein
VDAQDGRVPAPRRPALPRLRRAGAPAELPFALPPEEPPRVAELSALLGDIDALRLTLQTDLTLAAAALEAGATGLAGELVGGDLTEVRAFGERAAGRLSALESARDDAVPAAAPLPRRRILSAAPLMAAAAALIGFVAFVPDRGVPSTPQTSMTSAAMAGYELSRLAQSGAPDEELALAAEELNDELAELIAQAATDPAAAQQALMLLEATTEVLSRQGDSGVLRSVMAETQLLRARLREALPVTRPARSAVRKAPSESVLPLVKAQPEKSREAQTSSTKSSPTPKPSPTPSPSASPTSDPAPAAPAPGSSPSPAPEGSEGPLPQPGDDLPGW